MIYIALLESENKEDGSHYTTAELFSSKERALNFIYREAIKANCSSIDEQWLYDVFKFQDKFAYYKASIKVREVDKESK